MNVCTFHARYKVRVVFVFVGGLGGSLTPNTTNIHFKCGFNRIFWTVTLQQQFIKLNGDIKQHIICLLFDFCHFIYFNDSWLLKDGGGATVHISKAISRSPSSCSTDTRSSPGGILSCCIQIQLFFVIHRLKC